jgi:hypothetical protein
VSVRARGAARALALAAAGVALGGCETTVEKSAALERAAKHVALGNAGLSITRQSTSVKVLATALTRGGEGAAAAITLRNLTGRALKAIPIEITVRDRRGQVVYQNTAPGLEAGLVSVPSIAAHGEATWVDDQLSGGGGGASVSARLGEGSVAASAPPTMTLDGVHLEEVAGPEVTGTVRNTTHIAQRKLIVFALARRGGSIVAAGRGALPELAAGASQPFQVFLAGDPHGATLHLSAPATTWP